MGKSNANDFTKLISQVKFDDKGLVPAIIQDSDSGKVLMLAYMNKESIKKSLETGNTHFYSRSRQRLWMKGETSGHIQKIQEIYFDCDKDSMLIKVKQTDSACHTGHYSCFFNRLDGKYDMIETEDKADPKTNDKVCCAAEENTAESHAAVLFDLYDVIIGRKENPVEGSYTNYLFEKGLDKILKKVGEESAEVIIAAKNRSKSEVTYEVSDLIYHLIVLLVEQGVELEDIFKELAFRREKRKEEKTK